MQKNKKKLIIIFGPQAVGKMTIGMRLQEITGIKLFHNHMTIELVNKFFDYGDPEGKRLVDLFRKEIFKSVVNSDLQGLIFTYIWNFDSKEDWEYVEKIKEFFTQNNTDIYFVELEASLDERLVRNKTELRLKEKATKRDLKWSENNLREGFEEKRLNSIEDEITEKNYIRINNTNMSPEEVARKIDEEFKLKK